MRILSLSRAEERHLEQIRAVAPGLEVDATADAGRAAHLAADAEVIVGWHLPDSVLSEARALRWIHSTAAGVDRLLVPSVREGRVLLTSSVGQTGRSGPAGVCFRHAGHRDEEDAPAGCVRGAGATA